jgi:hypothetical protein
MVYFITLDLMGQSGLPLEKMILLDFDQIQLEKIQIITKSNTLAKPEIRQSELYIAPDGDSKLSLLFRLPRFEVVKLPWEIHFQDKIIFQNYIHSVEFPFYANNSGGELVVLVLDESFQIQRYSLGKLSKGWKTYSLRLSGRLSQIPRTFWSEAVIRLIGFLYYPPKIEGVNREDILVMDDIYYFCIPQVKIKP